MIKALVIAVAVVLMLYKFFGINFIYMLAVVIVALLALIYTNQNKMLYMPGKH